MKNIRIERVFKILTLVFFAIFFMGMIIAAFLDTVLNIKTNLQYLEMFFIVIFVLIFIIVILWNVSHIMNMSKAIIEDKEEIKKTKELLVETSSVLKTSYINTTKKEKILRAVFLIWFVATILLMFHFAGNNRIELILIAQYIIIFALVIILSLIKKHKD